MNIKQRLYESPEANNKLIKINNSFNLFKSLENIKNRKPIYISKDILHKKLTKSSSFINYERLKNNFFFSRLLQQIKDKKYHTPIVITEQNRIMNNTKEFREKQKIIKIENLKKANEMFKRRLKKQKPVISIKMLDQQYAEHFSLISSRKKGRRKLVLPPIKKI